MKKKFKLKWSIEKLREKFFNQCTNRFLYGDKKYGEQHYTSYSIDDLYNKLVLKINLINGHIDARKVIGGITRYPVCIQIEAVDLANYAMLLWMEAKILELKEKKLIEELPQFKSNSKLTAEQIRAWENNRDDK